MHFFRFESSANVFLHPIATSDNQQSIYMISLFGCGFAEVSLLSLPPSL